MRKTCRGCGVEKDDSEFHRSKRYKSGRLARCKQCMATVAAKYRDPAKNAERAKRWREAHPDYMSDHNRSYYAKNKEQEKARQRAWYAGNQQRAVDYRRDYYEAHRNDPDFKKETARRVREWNRRNRWHPRICAQKAVALAIRAGLLTRHPCQECGKVPSFAHHAQGYDLAHWFTVEWLCRKHHHDRHGYRCFS